MARVWTVSVVLIASVLCLGLASCGVKYESLHAGLDTHVKDATTAQCSTAELTDPTPNKARSYRNGFAFALQRVKHSKKLYCELLRNAPPLVVPDSIVEASAVDEINVDSTGEEVDLPSGVLIKLLEADSILNAQLYEHLNHEAEVLRTIYAELNYRQSEMDTALHLQYRHTLRKSKFQYQESLMELLFVMYKKGKRSERKAVLELIGKLEN